MCTKLLPAVAAALLFAASGAFAASPATSTFQVRATIAATCVILTSPDIDFGTLGVLTTNAQQSSNIQVQCTDTTPYNIGLNAGTGTGASVATRKMSNGGAVINYSLYTDQAHTIVWGNTINTDTVAATGNGASQSYPVYGLIPPQNTPAPGTYTDTITVTVTY
jgi:spore coat protein U-like protein